jgi:hypothetical protein
METILLFYDDYCAPMFLVYVQFFLSSLRTNDTTNPFGTMFSVFYAQMCVAYSFSSAFHFCIYFYVHKRSHFTKLSPILFRSYNLMRNHFKVYIHFLPTSAFLCVY